MKGRCWLSCPFSSNAPQASLDVLSIDTEVIVIKLLSYFSICPVQDTGLKNFCDYASIQHSLMFL